MTLNDIVQQLKSIKTLVELYKPKDCPANGGPNRDQLLLFLLDKLIKELEHDSF